MASPIFSKRPVILTLADLEQNPTSRARYEITLPFVTAKPFYENPLACNCPWPDDDDWWSGPSCKGCDLSISFAKSKAKGIKQTEKRWAWFSEARNLDDTLGRRLGTLGFLPLEIREMIWFAAINGYKETFQEQYAPWQRTEDPWEFVQIWLEEPLTFGARHYSSSQPPGHIIPLSIFELSSYAEFGPSMARGGKMHLRFASRSTKVELENAFISANSFIFYCPKGLDYFLDHLSACQTYRLRSITLKVFGCPDCDYRQSGHPLCRAWIAIVDRLPPTLQSVTFELGWHGTRLFPHRSSQFGRQGLDPKGIQMALGLLECMTKKIQRLAPRAVVSMGGLEERNDADREILQNLFDEVDPYSEGFKEWAVRSRSDAMSGGDGA